MPLSDGAGEVVAVGPEVTRVKIGDRVAGIFMQSWIGGEIDAADQASALGGAAHGVLANTVSSTREGWCICPKACPTRRVLHCPAPG